MGIDFIIRVCGARPAFLVLANVMTWCAYSGPVLAQTETTGDYGPLAPTHWEPGELERYQQLDEQFGGQNELAVSDKGVVAGTTSASAIRVGREALDRGGSAVDAALATALTQVVLSQGAWVSGSGIISMVCYDAESRQFYSMNGAYNSVAAEVDPGSIPAEASGRTALVPGFMAGVEAAHQRFGRLQFEDLVGPAVFFADKGFRLHSLHQENLQRRKDVLSRLPATRKLFENPDTGEFYKQGEVYRQPELAATLRKVAQQGAQYMYRGEWGRKFVAAVQADGGKMTMQDLLDYRVLWTNPIRIRHGDYEVFAPGLPAQGGMHLAESLNVLAEADFRSMGSHEESPEAFFWFSQANTLFVTSFIPPLAQRFVFGKQLSYAYRCTPEHARETWEKLRDGRISLMQRPAVGDNHSDAVVAIDQWGNVVSLVHTANTSAWGKTGLFVDGVSVPDSAATQQQLLSEITPGARLPDPTEPLIVAKDGQPVFALSSIGAGLHARTMTTLINLMYHNRNIRQANDAPSTHLPEFSESGQPVQVVFEGRFPAELIDQVKQLGLRITIHEPGMKQRAARGYVVGAAIDPVSGQRSAVGSDMLNAPALGQP